MAADVVHRPVLLAVRDDALAAVLEQQGSSEAKREVVHDSLQIHHSASTWALRHL